MTKLVLILLVFVVGCASVTPNNCVNRYIRHKKVRVCK